jgi:hypothetical protein
MCVCALIELFFFLLHLIFCSCYLECIMLDLRIALVCVSDLCVCVGVFVCLGWGVVWSKVSFMCYLRLLQFYTGG